MFDDNATGKIYKDTIPPKTTTLKWCKDDDTQNLHIEIDIPANELRDAYGELDEFILSLFRECEKSNKISDKLLALEHMVRNIESKTNP